MAIRDALLPEFDHEMANTRKSVERIPDDKHDFKPHDKSFSMRELASHLVNVPAWTEMTLTQDSFDIEPENAEPFTTPQGETTAKLLELFDANVKAARAALAGCDDDTFMKSWTLLKAGESIFTMPRAAIFRSFIMNHNVHHRAQLGVYLRLCDIPVPAVYGSSADEAGM